MPHPAVSTQVFGEHEITPQRLEVIRRSGFQWIEVFAAPGHFAWDDEQAVARLAGWLRDLGLRVCSLHAPWAPGQDIAALDPTQRERSLCAVERAVDALVALAGRHVVVHPGAEPAGAQATAQQLRLAEDGLARVASYCAARGVTAALENPPPYELCGAAADMLRLYRRLAGAPGLCGCFDTGHAHCTPEGVTSMARLPVEVAVIHLSDNYGQSDDHLPPTEGTIDWDAFFTMLAAKEWNGFLVLELTDRPNAADILQRGRGWLEAAVERYNRGS